jgi:hypothetical protein
LLLPPCLEPCLSWTVRRFPRFSFSFSTFRLPRRSVGYTVPSVAVEKRGQLSSRPPNYPLITCLDTLTLIHLFVFPSRSPSSSSSPLPLAAAQLPPPVVNKNRSAKLHKSSAPVPPTRVVLRTSGFFFSAGASVRRDEWIFAPSLHCTSLLRIIV